MRAGMGDVVFAPLYEALGNGAFARGALRVTVEQPGTNPLGALESGAAMLAVVSEPEPTVSL